MDVKDIFTITQLENAFKSIGYIPNKQILYTVLNAIKLKRPILVEGEPGVGKTELAKAISQVCSLEFLRIQFYEGISNSDILYEYDYPKQLLYMNAIKDNIYESIKGLQPQDALNKISSSIDFYGKDFLIERPLLKSINNSSQKVLLLDEVDKTSEETEYLLLEILSDFTMSIPELGKTIKCEEDNIPIVILTSNNYRELSDALKRRCLYLYIEPKTVDEMKDIIAVKANVDEEFARKVAEKVNCIRDLNLKQKPSVSEAIVWASSLIMNIKDDTFDQDLTDTLGVLLKNKSDIDIVKKSGIVSK